jgi:hypothetical protein
MAKSINDIDKPWVDNYPPLRDWLRKHEARCNWQLPLGNKSFPNAYVESWIAPNGREFVVVVQANRLGWNIYTPEPSSEIVGTLADAERRLGLA